MNSRNRFWLIVALAFVASCLAVTIAVGVFVLAHREDEASAGPRDLQPIAVRPSDLPEEPQGIELPLPCATDNGPAIAVWEPVAPSVDAQAAAFGAGAARWLCVAIGGLGQMGRQPAYPSLQRVADEMQRTDLRLNAADGLRAARMAGVTHFAAGEMSGAAGRLTLSFAVTDVASGKAVGAPISITGTAAELASQLPEFGKSLAERIGVKVSRLPSGPTPNAADLTTFGASPWQVLRHIPIAQLRGLEKLAPRLPAAGVCALDAVRQQDPDRLAAVMNATVAAAPDNAVVQMEAARQVCGNAPDREQRVSSLLRRFPNNYLLVRSDVRLQPSGTNDDAVAATRAGLTLSAANTDAWIAYSDALQAKAQAIRYSRVTSDITPSEWSALRTLYSEAEAAAARAVRLDPQNGNAWLQLCTAAQFGGDDDVADKAYWMAMHLCRENSHLFFWGLEMYQPKWRQNGAAKRQKVARLASIAVFDSPGVAEDVGRYLVDGQQRDLARPQFDRAIAGWKAFIAERPDETWPRLRLARTYEDMGRATAAIREYRGAIAARPSDVSARCALGYLYLNQGDYRNAAGAYEAALRIGPLDDVAHGKLGAALVGLKQWKRGAPEVRRGLKANPKWALGHVLLGDAYVRLGQTDDAITEYQAALQLYPRDGSSWDRLTRCLNEAKRFPEAVTAAENGLPYNHEYIYAYESLGEAYLGAGRYEESAVALERYVKQMNGDAGAHMLYARALFGLNRKAEAISECNTCIRLAPKSPAAGIARRLLKRRGGQASSSI
ncbi:MAG TPA: tetratricopeptide repeat protein [Armatimonadota bacterium]|jgi:tetratricopeptide (TPR) repeat protein